MVFKTWYFPLCIFLFFQACKPENEPKNDGSTTNYYIPAGMTGHQRMIAILDSIAQAASPEHCYNLNAKKAELILQQIKGLPPEQQPLAKFKYAEQLLYAGKTEAAIVLLEELVQLIGDVLDKDSKIVYDFLAVSYIRLGEVQNCVEQSASQSCIVPIQGNGVYSLKQGPETAVKIYERILKAFPDDLQTRWLMNIAYMNMGRYPTGVPKEYLIPENLFKSKGSLRFENIAPSIGMDIKGVSGGVCMEDFDGDGNLDLLMTAYMLKDPVRFFKNNGDGTFLERTHEANLDGIVSGLNTLHADYDNDGDRDVVILRGGWLAGGTHPNSLLRNNGDGTFTDVTIESGLLSFHPTQAAAWADYDGDGWLDLYIANETRPNYPNHPNELYHNNGMKDGKVTFTNVAKNLGVDFVGFYKGCVWGDLNNDRLPDLYLSCLQGDNKLLVNRGGKFEEIGVKAGVNNPQSSFPCEIFDFNNDGLDDIFVVGYSFDPTQDVGGDYLKELMGKLPDGDWLRLYINKGNESFTDIARNSDMNKLTFGMGNNFGDLDNDGWLDVYLGTGKPDYRALVPNRMFRNVEGKRLEDITMNGFAHLQKGHGIAFGDLDNDGDTDIYEVMGGAYEGDVANNILFENPGTPGNNWVNIELEGKTCNRDAFGSKIAVHTLQKGGTKRTIWMTVNTGGSFGSASLRQEFGLGKAEKIESVEVHWAKPGPEKVVYTDVPLNSFVKISEANPKVEVVQRQQFQFKGKAVK
ncbi:MAG: CRTAC1 family protein [Saprospiraceae bacterium]|nr:CRTAC1 family protein [Saprospiraceae bacterium]